MCMKSGSPDHSYSYSLYRDTLRHSSICIFEQFSTRSSICNSNKNKNKMKNLWFSSKCNVRESNPGLPRGRREFYHWTNVAYWDVPINLYIFYLNLIDQNAQTIFVNNLFKFIFCQMFTLDGGRWSVNWQ